MGLCVLKQTFYLKISNWLESSSKLYLHKVLSLRFHYNFLATTTTTAATTAATFHVGVTTTNIYHYKY